MTLEGDKMLKVIKITCEYQENPIGLGERRPRFSWIIESDGKDIKQTAYYIQISINKHFDKLVYDTGVVQSSESINIEYDGIPLLSSTRYFYRIKIWDNRGEESIWSDTVFFETGLFEKSEWKASFISTDDKDEEDSSQAKYVRYEFDLSKEIVSARVYATALGMYELYLNGTRVGDALLTPGWTNYKKRLQYQTYDVTNMLVKGSNAVGAQLGCGWYKGDLAGWVGQRNIYGKDKALLFQMLVKYKDETEELILSNAKWKVSKSPIIYSELYNGEVYDAALEQEGWNRPGFDDITWKSVRVIKQDLGIVIPQDGPYVKRQECIKPLAMFITPKGEQVIDFGQNLTGWVRFRVKGNKGDTVSIKHAEVLDSEGNFYTKNLRAAKQEIKYILKGEGDEVFEPHFTFQGFRYIQIEQFPMDLSLDCFEAIVIHSEMKQTGYFSCSNPLVNQLMKNVLWGLKGNFVDIPSDCPQRDERLGWTGDAQVFIRTSCFLMDTRSFFKKWLRDLKSEQFEDGGVPYVIPDVLTDVFQFDDKEQETKHSSTGWGDAAVICPWTIYHYYGDKQILEEQYESMQGWIKYIRSHAQDGLIWNTGFHFGDWVALDAKEGSCFGATPNDLTATAFYAYSTWIMIQTSRVLGLEKDEKMYTQLHQSIVEAFQKEFYTPNGRLAARTQTAHILALMFNLVPEGHRERTIDTLVQIIKENEGHLTTGFLGTPFICHVLSENGKLREAYELLLKEDYPSWLYQVTKGATTIWEHWDGLKPDGTMWSEEMNSFNHYAYGAIGDWLYKVVAGLDTGSKNPGYKEIMIKPQPGGGLTYVEAVYESMYGQILVKWEIKEGIMTVQVTVPHNTTAHIILPNITSGIEAQYKVGSGKHSFVYAY